MLNLAVIGDPISHSKSPIIHSTVLEELKIPYTYSSFQVKKGELEQFLKLAKEKEIHGFNITMPHKADIIPFLDEIDEEARRYQAVNTVKIDNGKLYGYNTDADGYTTALRDAGSDFTGKHVVILGAGGVVTTLARKAAYENAVKISILNRTIENAETIAALVSAETGIKTDSAGFDTVTLKKYAEQADLLINATPLGMHGVTQDFTDLCFVQCLKPNVMVSDLIYNPTETNFLKAAREHGCPTVNGLGMLLYQAFLADQIYTGLSFSFSNMKQRIENKIYVSSNL